MPCQTASAIYTHQKETSEMGWPPSLACCITGSLLVEITDGRPKTSWTQVIKKDISRLNLGWRLEDAEAVARDRTIWRRLSRQAAGAVMHDAAK